MTNTKIPIVISKSWCVRRQSNPLLAIWVGAILLCGSAPAWPESPASSASSTEVPAIPKTACTAVVSANEHKEPGEFATLEDARDYVRGIKGSATGPINVCLRGGTHVLTRTFTLGPQDSGTAAAPITYRSYPGEYAVISGGTKLDLTWERYSGEIYVATMHRKFNSLFVNGRRAIRARTPNGDGSFHLTPVADPSLQPSQFIYAPGSLPAGLDQSDIEIVSMERWFSPRQKINSTNATTIMVDGTIYEWYGYDYYSKDRYYVENSLAALDSPGEWYLDETAHKLYYWPRDLTEIKNGEFIAPHLFQLVSGGSYPENTAALKHGETGAYIPSCRHIGVYPGFPHLLSFANASFTIALWVRFPSATSPSPFWAFTKGNPQGKVAATGAGGNGYGLATDSTSVTVPVQFFVNDGTDRISANLARPAAGQLDPLGVRR